MSLPFEPYQELVRHDARGPDVGRGHNPGAQHLRRHEPARAQPCADMQCMRASLRTAPRQYTPRKHTALTAMLSMQSSQRNLWMQADAK